MKTKTIQNDQQITLIGKILGHFHVICPLVIALGLMFSNKGLVVVTDGISLGLVFQKIGIQELLRFNFAWTSKIGLGYPIVGDMMFQQLNVFNLLYLFLDPVKAFHVQVICWLLLAIALSAFSFRYLFGFGHFEIFVYLLLLASSDALRAHVAYQHFLLSSVALLPIIWYTSRKVFETGKAGFLILFTFILITLVNSMSSFGFVPNIITVSAIVYFEFTRGRLLFTGEMLKERRRTLLFISLCMVMTAVCFFYFFDIVHIIRNSNRAHIMGLFRYHTTEFIPRSVWHLGSVVFEPAALAALAIAVASKLIKRFPRVNLGSQGLFAFFVFLFVVFSLALPVYSSYKSYAARTGIIVYMAFSLYVAATLGQMKGIVRLDGTMLTFARVISVLIANVLFWHSTAIVPLQMNPNSIRAGFFQETRERIKLAFGGELPKDLGDYRIAQLNSEGFTYQFAGDPIRTNSLTDILFEPNWPAVMDMRGVGYYSNYIYETRPVSNTNYKHLTILYKEHLPPVEKYSREFDYGNLIMFERRAATSPVLRLLNVKYIFAEPPVLDSQRPIGGIKFRNYYNGLPSMQALYEISAPLPRAWALPIAESLLLEVNKAGEYGTEMLEKYILERLNDGTLERAIYPLDIQHEGSKIALYGLSRVKETLPAIVFVSEAYWSGWKIDSGGNVYNPFGLLATVLKEPEDHVVYKFNIPTLHMKLLALLLFLAGFIFLHFANRSD